MRATLAPLPLSLSLLVSLVLLATPLAGQMIRGRVIETGSGEGIEQTRVVLLDSAGVAVRETISDSAGLFTLYPPDFRFYRLRAGRIGYSTVVSDPFRVDMIIGVTLRLSVEPVEGDPLQVVSLRTPYLDRMGFYDRWSRGIGFFIPSEEIRSRPAPRITDVLRGYRAAQVVTIRPGEYDVILGSSASMAIRGRCFPTVVLDGVVVRYGGIEGDVETGRWDEIIHPSQVAGIEFYTSPSGVPTELTRGSSPCGAILIWTQR